MARRLDLERVKQAWEWRREGKQQQEIADALGMSLRHIQNYLSLDWLAQCSLRTLMKGGAEEVNEQLKALWAMGEVRSSGSLQSRYDSAGSSGKSGEGKGPPGGSSCNVPEIWPDVARLEDWGVPKFTAPGLLGAWRRAHREDTHELCALWGDLAEIVQAKIPFAEAYDLAITCWLADRWGVDLLRTITELYRLYRPWEGKVHLKVYLDEVRAAIGAITEESSSAQVNTLFEGLPRRFLHGLPRRYNRNTRDDRDD